MWCGESFFMIMVSSSMPICPWNSPRREILARCGSHGVIKGCDCFHFGPVSSLPVTRITQYHAVYQRWRESRPNWATSMPATFGGENNPTCCFSAFSFMRISFTSIDFVHVLRPNWHLDEAELGRIPDRQIWHIFRPPVIYFSSIL